jgi:hypothetical protein
MDELARPKLAGALIAAIALGAALSAPASEGSGYPPAPVPEADPGITVTGFGFAARRGARTEPADAAAVARAVGDARRRAGAIARALGIGAGIVEEVELREAGQFGERSPARIAVAVATVNFAIAAGAATAEGARRVGAFGAAAERVRPRDEERSRAIKRALLAARRAVLPAAAVAAARNARVAAEESGLALGGIVSVAEAPASPYGYGGYFYDAALGGFGPGRFCGYYRRPIVREDPATGVERVVRRVWKRRCPFPVRYGARIEIAYAAGAAI